MKSVEMCVFKNYILDQWFPKRANIISCKGKDVARNCCSVSTCAEVAPRGAYSAEEGRMWSGVFFLPQVRVWGISPEEFCFLEARRSVLLHPDVIFLFILFASIMRFIKKKYEYSIQQ